MSGSDLIFDFVLARLDDAPLAERVSLYRAMAGLAASNEQRSRFERLADDCAAIQAAHDQLVFDFKRRKKQ